LSVVLFDGPGEMRALCRAFPWEKTPLGAVTSWTHSLRSTATTMLAARHPMFLWWGADLVQLYNDAYRPSLGGGGRHPRALGMTGPAFWTDTWEVIAPEIEGVMKSGVSTWHVDALVPVHRNGRTEEASWTYGYSPVRDDDGAIGGCLVVCQETTPAVLAQRRVATRHRLVTTDARQNATASAMAATAILVSNARDIPFALCFLTPDDGAAQSLRCAATTGLRDASGLEAPSRWPIADVVASRGLQLVTLDAGTTMDGVGPWPEPPTAAVVVPLEEPATGLLLGALVLGLSARLSWDEDYEAYVRGVARDVASRIAASRHERERQLSGTILKNMSEGLCLVSPADGTIVYANPKFDRMLGYEPGELQGKPVAVVNEADNPEHAAAIAERIIDDIRSRGETTYEIRNVCKDKRVITCRATASLIAGDGERRDVIVAVQGDISEQKRLEMERDSFFTKSLGMLCVAGLDGYFRQLNPAWETTLGWSLDELAAKPSVDFVHPDDRAATIADGARLLQGALSVSFENRYACKDGSYRVLQWQSVAAVAQGLVFASAHDITELREAQQALHASLSEKEVLLKEIHHRVKNNLQVISSMLKLHGDQISDRDARAAFQDSQDRVRAIALLHEKLYQSKHFGAVDMAAYAESLLQTLMRTHGAVAPARVVVDAPGVSLPLDLAVPCGLILNELVTNALKHAFREHAGDRTIAIRMRTEGTMLALCVQDNGIGLRAGVDIQTATTLGLHLVRTLARQLHGELAVRSTTGTEWTLRFPHQPGGERR
jgi:PAS domain S-box-containing protein